MSTPDSLSSCDSEPIHIPGSIQPHGLLLVVDEPSLHIVQASANAAALLGLPWDQVLGKNVKDLLGDSLARGLDNTALEDNPQCIAKVAVGGVSNYVVAHRRSGLLLLELERSSQEDESPADPYVALRGFLSRLSDLSTEMSLGQLAAAEIRRLTGFDRVLVYRFDEEWNGCVIAEDRNDALPAYLDLRFPASDIPRQARDLYRVNTIRLIADANYEPVPVLPALHPRTGKPLDMSFSTLRSVSPIHVEYMKNMGTMASMSISLLRGGELWGLISCHHATPRLISFSRRAACDVVGKVLSLQLAAQERMRDDRIRVAAQSIQTRMLSVMAQAEHFGEALASQSEELLALTAATGVAVIYLGQIRLAGNTPTQAQVRRLTAWLTLQSGRSLFHTDSLANAFSEAEEYKDQASGLLAVSISEIHDSFVMWFRPEAIQAVQWAGDPRKPVDGPADGPRIHPRKSFERWKETVRLHSVPWRPIELEAAAALRNAIVGIVLRKAEELGQLSAELERANKELEAFSYSVSHDLRAPFRHIVGYSELLREDPEHELGERAKRYVDTVIESAHYAGTLVDNLLQFAQVGRASLQRAPIDMELLVSEVQREINAEEQQRTIEWHLHPLPAVQGDLFMLRLVLQNLLSNAVKYTRTRTPAVIEIGSETTARESIFYIRDNGVGFDMQYSDKLFGVFQRLHRMEEFEGTGIGLANVRRIVARHGGRTWAEGKLDEGATFYFSLPKENGTVKA